MLDNWCILGIASFGALLHGCLRHRSLPNSSMPIILSASCMYPIGGNIPMSPNHLHRKQHCQQQQQQYESQPRTLLMKPLTRHYFIPEDAYFTSDHCYHVNSDNRICNCGKTTERWNKRNLDYLLQINQLQASNDFKSTLLQENENAEYPSNTSPSLAITVSVAASAPSSAVQDNNNTANEHSFEPRNKLTNSVPCKLCRINSYPRHYVYQSEYANKLEKCLEYQAHGSCTYKDTDLNKEHYVKNSFHSNNINNWSTIDAPNSSSVGIIEKPLQSTHSHSLF
ncbi:unnamed protein product [Heterobilharzia americana]|nr:unnamed protein product [Heterobilharzia americana]